MKKTKTILIYLIIFGFVSLPVQIWSQDSTSGIRAAEQRPVFAEAAYDIFGEYGIITGNTSNNSHSESEVEFTQRTSLKLNFPLYLGKKIIVAGGLRHYMQRFSFDFDSLALQNLEGAGKLDEPLQRFGIRFYLMYRQNQKNTIYSRIGFDLNTERPIGEDFSRNYLKSSLQIIYGQQKNLNTEIGYGLGFGYEWGRPLVLPILSYKHRFNPRWDTEVYLPKSAQLRYTHSAKLFLRTHLQISGASYTLVEKNITGYRQIEIRQSEVSLSFHIDRELYDWLWLNVRAGLMRSLKMNIVEPDRLSERTIVTTSPFTNYFVGCNLFVVPPRWLYERYIK